MARFVDTTNNYTVQIDIFRVCGKRSVMADAAVWEKDIFHLFRSTPPVENNTYSG